MNEYMTYIFDTCELSPKKICSGNCNGCEKEKTFIDTKGRTFEIQGQDILEKAKQYQAEKGCNYEQALLAVSRKTKESEHGL